MFENPEMMGQLVGDRLDRRERQAAIRRIVVPARRRRRNPARTTRMTRVTWFGRRGSARRAKPATA